MKRQLSQNNLTKSERTLRRHTTLNETKNKHNLPTNYAEDLLNLELDIESEKNISIQTITRLIQLYMQAIEFYELQKNQRYQIFQQKLNKLFANPKVSQMLQQNSPPQHSQSQSPQKPSNQRQFAKQLKLEEINQQAVFEASTQPQSAKIMIKNLSEMGTQISNDVKIQSDQILQRIGKLKSKRLQKQNTLKNLNSNETPYLRDNEEKKTAPPQTLTCVQSITETQSEDDGNNANKKQNDEIRQKQITLLKQNCSDLTKLIENCKLRNFKSDLKNKLHFRQNSHFIQLEQINKLKQSQQIQEESSNQLKKRISLFTSKKQHETTCIKNNVENQLADEISDIIEKYTAKIKILKMKIAEHPQSSQFFSKLLTKAEQDQKLQIEKLKVSKN